MKKFIGFIFVILTCCYNTCFAEIIQTNDTKVIENMLASIDADTLVIFDVDDVLMHADDQILKSKNADACKPLVKKLKEQVGKDKIQDVTSIILLGRKNSPVDPRMISIIENLQKSDIKVLALTKCATGKFGLIPNTENWRIAELHKHEYYFDKSWQNLKDINLKSLMKVTNDANPIYKAGIVFVDQTGEKGPVLDAFLAYAKIKPKKIIFIDDKTKNLVSVEEFAKQNNIGFIGIEYTKALEDKEELNQNVAELQFEILEKEKKWISDNEAAELLRHRTKFK
jgi:FMN phosphatase YigB (HAD superfamily)